MTNQEALKLREVIEDLKLRLGEKAKRILDLEKQVDYHKEEAQLAELKYDNLKKAVETEANDRLNKLRGDLND
jgi:NifU-like protein involved in Fe-S cluster formation